MTAAARRKRTGGFTLVEVMVALSIFSLAVVGLMSAQTTSIKTVTLLDDRAYAEIVADNILVATSIDPAQLELGYSRGQQQVRDRMFNWVRNVRPSGQAGLVLVEVDVRVAGQDHVLYSISGFRGNR